MSATTSNFIEGGIIDPFGSPTGKPLTLAEQAAAEDARRRRELQDSATRSANTNRGAGDQGTIRRTEYDAASHINPATGKPWTGHERPDVDNSLGGVLSRGGEMVKDHPWLPLLPLAPLAMAAFAPAAGGAAAGGTTAAAEGATAAAPAITTGGPVTEATIAAPVATGAATGATSAAPAAPSAISAGAAFKEGAQIATAVAPMAYDAIAGGRTKEEKALIAKQQQMAAEAKARMAQVQESRMNALGQQLLAMNPRNQMMAKMFGPDAAFQPQEFAAMTQNPMPPPEMPPQLQALQGNTKPLTPEQKAAFAAFAKQKQQYEQGNQQRSDQMMNGIAPPGPGPAPLQQRTPQAARKY